MHWLLLKTNLNMFYRFVISCATAALFLVAVLQLFPTGLPRTFAFTVETTFVFVGVCVLYDLGLCILDHNCSHGGHRRLTHEECLKFRKTKRLKKRRG